MISACDCQLTIAELYAGRERRKDVLGTCETTSTTSGTMAVGRKENEGERGEGGRVYKTPNDGRRNLKSNEMIFSKEEAICPHGGEQRYSCLFRR